jgi:hypothetical protein
MTVPPTAIPVRRLSPARGAQMVDTFAAQGTFSRTAELAFGDGASVAAAGAAKGSVSAGTAVTDEVLTGPRSRAMQGNDYSAKVATRRCATAGAAREGGMVSTRILTRTVLQDIGTGEWENKGAGASAAGSYDWLTKNPLGLMSERESSTIRCGGWARWATAFVLAKAHRPLLPQSRPSYLSGTVPEMLKISQSSHTTTQTTRLKNTNARPTGVRYRAPPRAPRATPQILDVWSSCTFGRQFGGQRLAQANSRSAMAGPFSEAPIAATSSTAPTYTCRDTVGAALRVADTKFAARP